MDTSVQESTLCKYLSIYTLKQILTNRTIRFTQPSVFNDPFDMLPSYLDLVNQQQIYDVDLDAPENIEKVRSETLKSTPEFRKLLETHPKPEEFEQAWLLMQKALEPIMKDVVALHAKDISSKIKEKLHETISRNLGALCLTEKDDHPLMWAHYAEEHRGAVLILNTDSKFFDDPDNMPESQLDRIKYVSTRPKIRPEKFSESLKTIVFTKSEHWEYEQEWRYVAPLENAKKLTLRSGDELYLYPLPEDVIRGVIFGCRCSRLDRESIIELLEDSQLANVEIHDAEMDEREYTFRIVQKSNISIRNLTQLFESITQLSSLSFSREQLIDFRAVCATFQIFNTDGVSKLIQETNNHQHVEENDSELDVMIVDTESEKGVTDFFRKVAHIFRMSKTEKWDSFVASRNKTRLKQGKTPQISTQSIAETIGDPSKFLDAYFGVSNVIELNKFYSVYDEEFLSWYQKHILPVYNKYPAPKPLLSILETALSYSAKNTEDDLNVFDLLMAMLGEQSLAFECLSSLGMEDIAGLQSRLSEEQKNKFPADSPERQDVKVTVNTISSLSGMMPIMSVNSGVILDILVRFSTPVHNLLSEYNVNRFALHSEIADRKCWLFPEGSDFV